MSESVSVSIKRARVLILPVWLLALTPCLYSAQVFRVQISSPANTQANRAGSRNPRPITVAVDLDEYVEGVLAGEASTLRSPQALNAMAVIVRTWALRYRGRHHAQGFDFCTLTHCQVFRRAQDSSGGYRDAVIRAVRETWDEVLEYQGQLIDPYFSADCGGATESAADVWPDKALPYLQALPDPYCAGSSHSSWERAISLRALEMVLQHDMAVPLNGPLRGLGVASRDSSGRARTLAVEADTRLLIDANQFRYAVDRRLGWGKIKSNLYTVERRGDDLVFIGRGLGHGVGLCQAGAEAMGRLGISYKRILAQYFPGAAVVQCRCRAAADPVASSEHFELAYPDTQQRWVDESLSILERARKELATPAGAWPTKVRVQTWDRTADFILATGKPGWVAGTNDGKSVFLQPLGVLAAKGILRTTLRHELAHLAIHRLCAPGVPSWLEEGLALYLTGERIGLDPHRAHSRRTLGEAIGRSQSESEMREAYARASLLVRNLAARRGPDAVWQVLGHPTPADLAWLNKESARPLGP
jgi:stage II sporulation protein D